MEKPKSIREKILTVSTKEEATTLYFESVLKCDAAPRTLKRWRSALKKRLSQ